MLGAILQEPQRLHDALESVKPEDFTVERHADVFRAMCWLDEQGKPADATLIVQRMADLGVPSNEQAFDVVLGLVQYGLPSTVPHYAAEVADRAKLRNLRQIGVRISELATDSSQTPAEAVSEAQRLVFELSADNKASSVHRLSDVFERVQDEFQILAEGRAPLGVPTGWQDFDAKIAMKPGHVIVLAARPSMGKSALAFSMAAKIAGRGVPVGCYSLEMSPESLGQRLMSSATQIPAQVFRSPSNQTIREDSEKMAAAIQQAKGTPLYIVDAPGMSLATLTNTARRLVSQHGVKFLVIDYLQIMQMPKAGNRNEQVGILSGQIKRLARELNIPIVLLSQLSRGVENRDCKVPNLADLRDSGSIEQDADTVLFLYREDYYALRKDPEAQPTNQAVVVCAKQREGAVGNVPLYFDPERQTFSNWTKEDAICMSA